MPETPALSTQKTTLGVVVLLILTGLALLTIFSTEPKAEREGAVKKTAMLVDVVELSKSSYKPNLKALGIVVPGQEVALNSRVSGEIIEISEHFIPGGMIAKDELLVVLDGEDYQLQLGRAQAELKQAESDYTIEMGEQVRAKNIFDSLNKKLSPMNADLVLRKPQLKQVEARMQQAQTAVKSAELDLERSRIKAPFNAQVVERNVNLGSQVRVGTTLARLIGTEFIWVEVTIPVHQLQWLDMSESADDVSLRNTTAWPEKISRNGRLKRVFAELDEQTRMAKVLVEVIDPLGQKNTDHAAYPLIAGSYLEAMLPVKSLDNVYRIEQQYVRKNDSLWIYRNDKLVILTIEPLFKDERYVYFEAELETGDSLITTDLSRVVEGAAVRIKSEAQGFSADE